MVGRVGENLQPVFLEQMAALDNDLPTDTGPTERACIWAESGMLFVESVLRTQWPEWHNTENTFRATKRRPPLPADQQAGAGLHRYLSSDVYSPAEMRRSRCRRARPSEQRYSWRPASSPQRRSRSQ
jgi:hypothetical protein